MALVFYYKDMLEKVKMREPSNSELFFVTERTQLNAAHAQLLKSWDQKLPISNDQVVSISRKTSQSLEFQEILAKIVQKTREWSHDLSHVIIIS